tara:strand:+ start:258 stop:1100 length:843 start_codon:yes stop_codon:yes gene_type:complete
MKNKTVLVVLGIDSHLPRIKKCISTLEAVYDDHQGLDIAIATYGPKALPPSKKLKVYCADKGFYYYDAERQHYFKRDKKLEFYPHPTHELTANLGMSKHFYDMGYEEVYLLHNDMLIVRDFLPIFRSMQKGDWSVVAPTLVKEEEKTYTTLEAIKSVPPLKRTRELMKVRVTQTVLTFNKNLVNKIFDKYKNEETMYKKYLYKYSSYGDFALVQLFDNFLGFEVSVIPPDITTAIDLSWTWCTKERILQEKNITHLHGESVINKFGSQIFDLIEKTNNEE